MPDGAESLLGEQLSAAVQIPYKNIALAQETGKTALNAFLAAQQVNTKRRQLENQLQKMQFDMSYKEAEWKRKSDMDAFMQQYRYDNLNRQVDDQAQKAWFENRRADDAEKKATWYMTRKDAAMQDSGNMGDELRTAAQKFNPWSQEFKSEINLIKSKYHTVLGTEEGRRVAEDFDKDVRRSVESAHRNAKDMADNVKENLNIIGKSKEFNLDDFTIGRWGEVKDKSGKPTGDKWIATDAKGNRLSPEQVKAIPDPQAAGVKFHTIDSKNYRINKRLADQVQKYGGLDLGEKPAVPGPQSRTDRARQALDDPEATEQEKAAARKILGQ